MDLQDVLKQAMKLELEGRDFYREFAENVEDEGASEMFEMLAGDEVDHYHYIERQYEALQEGAGWSPIDELEVVKSIDAISITFPPREVAVNEIPEPITLENALVFALNVESRFFELYRNNAKQVQDPDAKQLFLQLAAAEQRHFDTLMQRYESRFSYPR